MTETPSRPEGDEALRERIRIAIGYAWSEAMIDAFTDAVMRELREDDE